MDFSIGSSLIGPAPLPVSTRMPLVDFARLAEDTGFESIMWGEHTHIPVHHETRFPLTGGDIPEDFAYFWDPLVAAATAAAVTTKLKVGFSVLLVTERDPIVLAKEISTLDQLSAGRVIVGVGSGWLDEELRNHGVEPRDKTAVLTERVLAMKAIWTQPEAAFHGKHVNFDEIWQWPKPVQQPHPPILLGGHGKRIIQRVVDLDAEWLAPVWRFTREEFEGRMRELADLVAERSAPCVRVSAGVAGPLGEAPGPEDFEWLMKLGIDRCMVSVGAGEPHEVVEQVKALAAMIEPFRT
jgi:probable F420-dependent oxidoreductase